MRSILINCGAIVVMSVCVLSTCGCMSKSESASASADHDDDHEHAGHHAPAHKPKDLPEAVKRLRELNRQIEVAVSQGKRPSLIEDRTLPIALDIATWLPEIAGDSDLPRPLWNKVNSQCEIIVVNYRKVLDSAPDAQQDSVVSAVRANEQPITGCCCQSARWESFRSLARCAARVSRQARLWLLP
jgi:hypothetical protein